jgi:hypothetical protein
MPRPVSRRVPGVVLLAAAAGAYLLHPQPVVDPAALVMPAIVMSSGGGLESTSDQWSIAVDGSWTRTRTVRTNPQAITSRTGHLSEGQRRDLARLSTNPALLAEMRAPNPRCTISDGPSERLDVGAVRYWTSWCGALRPHVTQIRTRIETLIG